MDLALNNIQKLICHKTQPATKKLGFNLGRVLPKTQKMVLDASLLNAQHYKIPIKGKWGKSEKALPLHICSSYWKRILRVTLDFSQPMSCDYFYSFEHKNKILWS